MCGIAGFVDFRGRSTLQDLQRMGESLVHRGPDGHGHDLRTHGEAQLGLAHRRLSILDLSEAGEQPMQRGALRVVFNGEIYNYRELREELVALGHDFRTETDTEVVLQSWRAWGEGAIDRWHGMFALALFDAERGELTCVRDRAGAKPLYWALQDGLFLFGSELKALMAHPAFVRRIDPAAVASFMQYGYVPGPHAIFQGSAKLLPGHLLRLRLDDRAVRTRRYWNVYDAYNRERLDLSFEEAVQETSRVLQRSFARRMVADVPVGVFLSGGYDSTCVTALLQSTRSEKLKTFTVGMPDGQLDEAPFARAIAAHLGTDHTEYYCTPADALALVPELPNHYDEPFADSSAIPTILVSRLAREQVTVALSADAGDEIFAGYNRYDYASRFLAPLQATPAPLRRAMAALMQAVPSSAVPVLRDRALFHGRYDKIKNLLRDPSTAELLKNLVRAFSDAEVGALMAEPVRLPTTALDRSELRDGENDKLAYMMAMDWRSYLVDDILQKVDRATMSVSLEGREPFLDQDVIEWAARLPAEYKYRAGQKKIILKAIVHRHVPKALMDRPKMGFAIPVHRWLHGELAPLVHERLQPSALAAHGLFEAEAVATLVRDFYAGRSDHLLKLWHLLSFQLWYDRWMR